ncbi:hypothetical protein MMC32_000794 [Xylographa parallela]|nr:hypothetical protein [Xylographa parallela]
MVFPVLNPTYLYNETWPGNTSSLGIWRASLIFTGLTATIIFCLIFVTTLPRIRGKHFNLFYFTHLLSIVAVIVICLHASTMFYCTAPGLIMWLLDWGMRLYELRKKLDGKVIHLGNGWYSLVLGLPRHRLDGCACTSPLAHFYIHHAESSMRELHPFTTITHLASQNRLTPQTEDDLPVQFLFRKRGVARVSGTTPKKHAWISVLNFFSVKPKPSFQWTDKLAGLADRAPSVSEDVEKIALDRSSLTLPSGQSQTGNLDQAQPLSMVDIGLRLEGPYFTPADPSRYKTVICFVAGTGVSGAIAIAAAFIDMKRQQMATREEDTLSSSKEVLSVPALCSSSKYSGSSTWQRCVVFWSVRADDYVELPFFDGEPLAEIKLANALLEEADTFDRLDPSSSLELRVHRTGKGRPRLDVAEALASVCDEMPGGSTWCYLSGPNAFIAAGEAACKARDGVDFYGARWDI